MSFRDNLQHLRATRNMTQEQLAMLLGVSRQSVSKWEAERAYPEMDKLIKLCSLFECTLDELVSGDLTARPADAASSMPTVRVPQDVTGYDQAMRAFAWKLPLGVSAFALCIALGMLLAGLAPLPGVDPWNYAGVAALAGVSVGLAIILPASFERAGFRKAHPFVEDFYTSDQDVQARSALAAGAVAGSILVVAGLAAAIVLQASVWFAASVFFALAGAGAFLIVRGCLLRARCDVDAFNLKSLHCMNEADIDDLDDEELRARARQIKRDANLLRVIMYAATAIALVLLFVPALGAQRWFWLPWAIGGALYSAIKAFRVMRGDE